jgi:chromosome partitioning protein
MYIIAISNEKGGVAKTTTTVSLGAALAEQGKHVLLIDLDPQANLTLALGKEPGKIPQTIAVVFLQKRRLDSVVLETSTPRLDLVPSNEEMGTCERCLPDQAEYEFTLKRAITQSLSGYDVVLIDCPPSLGVVSLNAYVAADLLIVPTQAEYFSIYALRNLMAWIRKIRAQYNPGLTYRLLLTLYDRRNRSHRVLYDQLKTSFGKGVMNTVIEIDTKLRESPLAGVPILVHAPKSRAAQQYRALAEEITAYVEETTLQSS